jgi:hypothetical protein
MLKSRSIRWMRRFVGVVVVVMAACTGRMYIRIAPPPQQVEVISPQPGEMYVWVEGFWVWSDYLYIWSPGRWVRAPSAGAAWVPGEWRETRKGYYRIPGRWR